MTTSVATTSVTPAWKLWTGRVLSALPSLMMLFSGGMKLSHAAQFLEAWTGKFGFPESAATPIGIVELACVVIYVVPKTRVLGAILMTGYLGGAVVTHVRIGEPWIMPALLGVFAWGGLFLRDERVRELIPLTK